MRVKHTFRILALAAPLGLFFSGDPAAAAAPDATLVTSYFFLDSARTEVAWSTCGQTQNTTGCYGGGNLGPLGKIGALLEGKPKVNSSTNTVTRNIYLLDIAAGNNLNQVQLYVYSKRDTITPDTDNVTVVLSQTISLPLKGGTTARALMAANDNFIFIGTSNGSHVVKLQKRTFAVTDIPSQGLPPLNVSAITANQYGYVTVTYGPFDPTQNSAYDIYDQLGQNVQVGGGASFVVGTQEGALPGPLK
jgi:hypothetical protein